jgi:hypothetical protein
MNDTDGKLFTELFSLVSAHLRIPEPREYTPDAKEQRAELLQDRAADVRIFLGMGADQGVDPDHIQTTVKMLRERQGRPLPYEPETEEQARMCACGSKSRFHDADGKMVIRYEWQTHSCDGFTPELTEERE